MELLLDILGRGFTAIVTVGVIYVIVILLTIGLDVLTRHND